MNLGSVNYSVSVLPLSGIFQRATTVSECTKTSAVQLSRTNKQMAISYCHYNNIIRATTLFMSAYVIHLLFIQDKQTDGY